MVMNGTVVSVRIAVQLDTNTMEVVAKSAEKLVIRKIYVLYAMDQVIIIQVLMV